MTASSASTCASASERARRAAPAWLLLAASPLAGACDLERPLAQAVDSLSLIETGERLATASGCRVVLDPALVAHAPRVTLARGLGVADALDQLAAAHGLNWRFAADGALEIVAGATATAAAHASATLTIEADAERGDGIGLVALARLPSERSVVVARTRLDRERLADDAVHDYTSAVARGPGVYGMAATDAIRGVGASRLQPNQRASLVSLDGVPLPAEAWLFSRPQLSLLQEIEVTRSGTGLALAYAQGAGDVALATRSPAAAWHATAIVADAPALAPRAAVAGTGDFGVPGLETAFGHSRQLEADTPEATSTASDVLQQRQSALRLRWRDEDGRQQWLASALDFAHLDLGGALAEGNCGRERCPAGADVRAHGAALGWSWQGSEALALTAQVAGSDTRAQFVRLDGEGQLARSPPGYYRLRHADLRADLGGGGASSWSLGLALAQRENRSFQPRRFTINAASASALGMVPAGPGNGLLRFTSETNLRTRLPQAYGEWRYDDGARWDGHVGLRWIDADSASIASSHDVEEQNCRLVPGRFPEHLQRCSDVVRDRSERNAQQRRESRRLLPNAALRRRFGATQWLALQWREALVASDLESVALSPHSALEHLSSAELAWHRELGARQQLELRLFHHDWRDRIANLDAPFADATRFSSRVLGSEFEYRLQLAEHSEVWAHAGVLRARSDLVLDGARDRAVRGAPPWSLGVGGRHRFDRGLYLGGHFSHAAATWTVNPDGSSEMLASRDLLDLRVGYRRDRLDLSLWGSNLLDDDYAVDAYGRGASHTPYQSEDRVVGVDLRLEF